MIDLKSLKKSVQDLGARRKDLRSQIETLQRQREDIATAPPAREDVKAALRGWVEDKAAAYQRLLYGRLDPLLRRPETLTDPARVAKVMTLPIVRDVNATASVQAMDEVLSFAFQAPLIAALTQAVDSMPFDEGLPMTKRAASIAKLDEQIEALLAQEQELIDGARSAGIAIFE